MDELYHYCSVETLYSIIENQKLRFTDITKSNDSKEIRLLIDKCLKYIDKESNGGLAYDGARALFKIQKEQNVFFTACFSEKKNSCYMWKHYAKHGVAIGFDKEKLKKLCNKIMIDNNAIYIDNCSCQNVVTLKKVNYVNQKEAKALVEKFFSIPCDYTLTPISDIYSKTPYNKTDKWKKEHEWRIVIRAQLNQSTTSSIDSNDNTKIKIECDIRNNHFKKFYCDIPISADYISTIVLSPNCSALVCDIKKMLLFNGYNIDKIRIEYAHNEE